MLIQLRKERLHSKKSLTYDHVDKFCRIKISIYHYKFSNQSQS